MPNTRNSEYGEWIGEKKEKKKEKANRTGGESSVCDGLHGLQGGQGPDEGRVGDGGGSRESRRGLLER